MGVPERYEYSDGGLQTARIDRNGNRTEFVHDTLGRQIAVISPDGNSRTENLLDIMGRVVSVSVNGVVAFQRVFNLAGQLTEERKFGA